MARYFYQTRIGTILVLINGQLFYRVFTSDSSLVLSKFFFSSIDSQHGTNHTCAVLYEEASRLCHLPLQTFLNVSWDQKLSVQHIPCFADVARAAFWSVSKTISVQSCFVFLESKALEEKIHTHNRAHSCNLSIKSHKNKDHEINKRKKQESGSYQFATQDPQNKLLHFSTSRITRERRQ
jgi:hypothetical protein